MTIDPKEFIQHAVASKSYQVGEETMANVLAFGRKYPAEVNVNMLLDIADMILNAYKQGGLDASENFLDVLRIIMSVPVSDLPR